MDWEGALVRFRISFALPEGQSSNEHAAGNLRKTERTIPYGEFVLEIRTRLNAELPDLSPRANYTDRATVACRAS
jgi:hypothetical protein